MSISDKEIVFWIKCIVVAGFVTWLAVSRDLVEGLAAGDMRSAVGVIAQLSGTMVGFVLAALAILTAMGDSPLIRNMLRTGHFQLLLRRMLVCMIVFGVSTLIGATYLFIPVLTSIHCYVLLSISFFAMLLLSDVCRKFWIVLSNLNPVP